MGCGDSKAESVPQQKQPQENNNTDVRQSPHKKAHFQINQNTTFGENDDYGAAATPNKKKKLQKYKSREENSPRGPEEKENVMKIKKAKELEMKPQDEQFINNILQKSKAKLPPPTIEARNAQLSKPVVEYSPKKKGEILASESQHLKKSHWSKPIAGSGPQQYDMEGGYSRVHGNDPKSPYKKKQIEKRLNNIREGRTLGGAEELTLIDSSKTIYI